MYLLRMRDGLEVDYPALADYMGHHAFTDMVREFIQVYPSRSYTLNRLSDPLPKFLETWGKARGRRLLTDLADRPAASVFDRTALQRLISEHRGGQQDHSEALWTVLNLVTWREAFAC
mgnify:CR=1 FL=1